MLSKDITFTQKTVLALLTSIILCMHHTPVQLKQKLTRVWAALHDRLDFKMMVLVYSGRMTSYYQVVHDIALLVVDQ